MEAVKLCSKCGTTKPVSEFYLDPRNRSGRKLCCKKCQNHLNEMLRRRYRAGWESFFKGVYAVAPTCQCCGKELQWSASQKGQAVHFDHRHNGTACITQIPAMWLNHHPPNRQNKELFMSCDFGILCNECNKKLPTLNRKEWLRQAIRYTYKGGTNGKAVEWGYVGASGAKATEAPCQEAGTSTA